MDKFTPEYIQNVQQIIKNDEKDKARELLKDLQGRTGLDIIRVEVGHIDFLRDTTMLKIYYEPLKDEINTIDTLTRLPKENE